MAVLKIILDKPCFLCYLDYVIKIVHPTRPSPQAFHLRICPQFNRKFINGCVYWDGLNYKATPNKPLYKNAQIEIWTRSPLLDSETFSITAHEIGHALTWRYLHFPCGYTPPGIVLIREEVLAWRVAKSFIKSKAWNEAFACQCLKEHIVKELGFFGIKLDRLVSRLKIVPLNKGIKFSPDL